MLNKLFCGLILLCLSFKAVGYEKVDFFFHKISLERGLSNSTVYSMTQDRNGNLWVGTSDGLNKYDGYHFSVYRNDATVASSLCSNQIRCVKMDEIGLLWIGTMQGLSFYDAKKNAFENFSLFQNDDWIQIYDIDFLDSKDLLLATNFGLYLFDKHSHSFRKAEGFPNHKAFSVLHHTDYVLVGTFNGLYRYFPNIGKSESVSSLFDNCQISSLLYDASNGVFWAGTEGKGLFRINLSEWSIRQFTHDKQRPSSISSNFIRSLCFDEQQRLWIGTFVGLNIFNEVDGSFLSFFHDGSEVGSISQNSIRSIFRDAQGGMWLGTYFGGLNYYHPLKTRFQHIYPKPGVNSLNDNVVSCMEVAGNGDIWIGTNDNGLNLYNPQTGNFQHFVHREMDARSLGGNNVKALYIDKGNKLFVGTHGGGLGHFNPASRSFTPIFLSVDALANNNVYALEEDERGFLWVGTLNGLFRLDYERGQSVMFEQDGAGRSLVDNMITCLFMDSHQKLWIGSEKGLNRYHGATDKLETMQAPDTQASINFVTCLYESSDGKVWIGTRDGLFVYSEQDGHFEFFDTKRGLPNNTVYGIQEDSFKHFWISTNDGLACYMPENGLFKIYKDIDGIQSNQFNMYASCKTKDGRMYFGGINGITAFLPERIMDNPFSPKPTITKMFLFNKQVFPGDETGILDCNIENATSITLKADQSVLGFEFGVPNFLAGTRNTFAYMLEGFDSEWYFTTDLRQVSYSNLKPDIYRFLVKAANNDGKWNNEAAVLEIRVLPPWYATWWARTVFVLLFFGFIFMGYRFWLARHQTLQSLAFERLEKAKNEEVNRVMIRFFINVAHEFRTPLTLILSPLGEVLSRGVKDRWLHSQLETMQRSGQKLMNLVNLILDYRKAELGAFVLKVSKVAISDYLEEVIRIFDHYVKKHKIDLLLESKVGDQRYWLDKNYLERIVFNLLSNAFKFTPEGGVIKITVYEADGMLVVSVKDNGCGIALEHQTKIFDHFYQTDKHISGTGIGLSLVHRLVVNHHGDVRVVSEVNQGSEFIVRFPIDGSVYDYKNRVDEQDERKFVISDHLKMMVDEIGHSNSLIDDKGESIEKKGIILIVEDDEEVRNYLSRAFRSDYEVLLASHGEEGLSVLKESDVDLIISDVMMPVMDGFKFCRMVKQNIRTCHIPVILLTAKAGLEHEAEGLTVGADEYLSKPFALPILNMKVQNLLKMQKRLQYHFSQSDEVCASQITQNHQDQELLQKAMEIVEKNLENADFSADDFCREMGMSRSNLHLKLKSITGESTIEFIRKIRFNYACKLLKEGRYTIAEISTMVGFNSPSYFATSFKKYMGCMPTEYVKNIRI